MSVRLSRSGFALALALFCSAAVMMCGVQAQDGKSAAPAVSPAGTIAPSQPSAKPDALKQLEDELRHSLESLSPRSAPDSGIAPPYRPPTVVIPNRRAKDAEDRRKNWLLQDPEKLQSGFSERDWLNSPDNPLDPKAKTRNSLDDFYERLKQGTSSPLMPRAADADPLALSPSGKTGAPASRDNANLPSSIRDSANRLQDFLGGFGRTGDRAAPAESGGLPSLFGRGDKDLSPEDIKAHKAYMDEFQKVLNGSVLPPANTFSPPIPLSSGNSTLGQLPGTGLDAFSSSARPKGLDSLPGMVTTVRNPTTLLDPNASTLNQWNPLYSPPKVEPPKPAPLTVPQAEAPRRRF